MGRHKLMLKNVSRCQKLSFHVWHAYAMDFISPLYLLLVLILEATYLVLVKFL